MSKRLPGDPITTRGELEEARRWLTLAVEDKSTLSGAPFQDIVGECLALLDWAFAQGNGRGFVSVPEALSGQPGARRGILRSAQDETGFMGLETGSGDERDGG